MKISPVRSGRSVCGPPTLRRWAPRARIGGVSAGSIFGLLVGCASPGPPRPPSLYLPAVVSDLSAERAGDNVLLRWTTSAETTEGLSLGDRVTTAEVCREVGAEEGLCLPVARVGVHPGPTSATDVLPESLIGGVPGVLRYKVRLLNAAGRDAGWSGEALSARGVAPPAVKELAVRPTEQGAKITWAAEPGEAGFEIEREEVPPPGTVEGRGVNGAGLASASRGVVQRTRAGSKDVDKAVRLFVPGKRTGNASGSLPTGAGEDPGGALDSGAVVGKTYVYRVQRVRTLAVQGHTVAIRGPMSEPVEVRVRDLFAPRAPTGIAGIPACSERKLTMDLSWEPNSEGDLAGYFVYRRSGEDGQAWTKLTPEPIEAPAFRDASVAGRGDLRYRITAVDRSGNESVPSAEFFPVGEELRSEPCSA